MIIFFCLFVFAYLAGSINFSILLFKILGKEDPRNRFSGNAGATNVYRQAGIYWAIVVLMLDMGRAIGIAFISVALLSNDYVPFIGFGIILGNRFPCFHDFKGGKGVANYFGFTAALTPISAVIGGLVWITVYAFLRVPFISSFFMVLILAGGTLIDYNSQQIAFAGVLITAFFIIISHKKNMIEWFRSRGTR